MGGHKHSPEPLGESDVWLIFLLMSTGSFMWSWHLSQTYQWQLPEQLLLQPPELYGKWNEASLPYLWTVQLWEGTWGVGRWPYHIKWQIALAQQATGMRTMWSHSGFRWDYLIKCSLQPDSEFCPAFTNIKSFPLYCWPNLSSTASLHFTLMYVNPLFPFLPSAPKSLLQFYNLILYLYNTFSPSHFSTSN